MTKTCKYHHLNITITHVHQLELIWQNPALGTETVNKHDNYSHRILNLFTAWSNMAEITFTSFSDSGPHD